ncbi:GMP synthase [Marinobacterium lacunae]|uniref:GMP synthase n=1 Tax=Marinobacterium lacunae TaxID=1232683 RepID=A0A081G2M0_9GAMM|nr:type 1 glutamine amidotransferase [Marinobacterium lacunae]KEA65025.1 GMP synthase [Marinobacterium lacunae]MBR9884729.1 type 1 glutamine amidotransferase [Oceanospirillales bacterium]
MATIRATLRLLLLQIRDGDQVRHEEHQSFANYCQVKPEQIEILNVFDTPSFTATAAEGYDALLVGGASEANVLEPERYPFVHDAQRLIAQCLERDLPVFASCFGFQLAVLALGGAILHRDEGFEMGTLPISLTSEAADDPLFADIPDPFMAVSVHRQYTDRLPESCQVLAFTDQCIHAFRVRGRRFWAFQFHPEVDKRILVERLTYYKAHYTDGDDHLQTVLDNAVETPDSNRLMTAFVDRVLLGDSGRD